MRSPQCASRSKSQGSGGLPRAGHPTAELSQALDQLIDWKVWFSESENQSIFRKTYLRGQYEDGPLRPDYLTVAFGRLVKRSGLPPVRLHDLRHGAATMMLPRGTELKVIADQLGHSSVVLTADSYLSVAVELGLKSAAAAARLILSHAGRPPGGGTTRRPSAPPQAIITSLLFPASLPAGGLRQGGHPGSLPAWAQEDHRKRRHAA